jgi:hypothetical protein
VEAAARAEEAAARAVEAAGLDGVAAGLVGELPLSLLSLFVLGFRVAASLLDHHKKGPTPPFTTRQGPNAPINYQTRLIHDFAVSFLYYCEFNCKRIIIIIFIS